MLSLNIKNKNNVYNLIMIRFKRNDLIYSRKWFLPCSLFHVLRQISCTLLRRGKNYNIYKIILKKYSNFNKNIIYFQIKPTFIFKYKNNKKTKNINFTQKQ
jgi:hypothetical protein